MTSPSEPVESREQPRELAEGLTDFALADALSPILNTMLDEGSDEEPDQYDLARVAINHLRSRPRDELATLLGFPSDDASIRNLETLRDVHRRAIDDLISEAQTAGATIRELRAGYESRKLTGEVWETCARGMGERYNVALAERDRARGVAADLEAEHAHALAEVSRLREQGARDGEDETPWIENAVPTAGQLLHRLRTDPDFRSRFVEAAIEYQGASERCWRGFHVERLAELESANLALREQGEAVRALLGAIAHAPCVDWTDVELVFEAGTVVITHEERRLLMSLVQAAREGE